jgi:hypothetical protein
MVSRCATDPREQCANTTFQLRAVPPSLFMGTLPIFSGHTGALLVHIYFRFRFRHCSWQQVAIRKGRTPVNMLGEAESLAKKIHDWVSCLVLDVAESRCPATHA